MNPQFSVFEREVIECILRLPVSFQNALIEQLNASTIKREVSATNYAMILQPNILVCSAICFRSIIVEIVIDPMVFSDSIIMETATAKHFFSTESICICMFIDTNGYLYEIEVFSISGEVLDTNHLKNGEVTYWFKSTEAQGTVLCVDSFKTGDGSVS